MKLFRPVNKAELDLIEAADWKKFPPRLPEQPIFYPVLNIEYARQISIEWNLPFYGAGYILQFEVKDDYVKNFEKKVVGSMMHEELWVPSENLEEFNNNIIGKIELVEIIK
ncbi:MAG: hypothetical protein K1X86_00935 [Ignavibacteria bacterium]|nr:hypothetical protein [Ignavibacteria bacterium]